MTGFKNGCRPAVGVLRCCSSQGRRLDLGRSSYLYHSTDLETDSSWGLVCWVTECCCVKEPLTGKLTAQESSPLQISPPRGLMLRSPNSQEVARPQRPEVEELQSFCPGWESSPIDSQGIMGLVGPQPKDNFVTIAAIWPASALVQHTAVSQRENSQPALKDSVCRTVFSGASFGIRISKLSGSLCLWNRVRGQEVQ